MLTRALARSLFRLCEEACTVGRQHHSNLPEVLILRWELLVESLLAGCLLAPFLLHHLVFHYSSSLPLLVFDAALLTTFIVVHARTSFCIPVSNSSY